MQDVVGRLEKSSGHCNFQKRGPFLARPNPFLIAKGILEQLEAIVLQLALILVFFKLIISRVI